MMDKTYILENNLLERYVLGELSHSESEELEAILINDSDLKSKLKSIEEQFEQLAHENSISPPERIKSQVLDQITKTNDTIITLPSSQSNTSYWKIATGIAAVLVIGLFYLFNQLNSTKKQLQVVEQENLQLKEEFNILNDNLQTTNSWYAVINDPDVKKYVLKGNDLLPEATVISYVNDKKKSVVVNTERLPETDTNHDYQMWADVEGEMINMGIIDKNKDMIAMNYIDNAESLNITIEPVGGSEHPTVSKLISNIYLK